MTSAATETIDGVTYEVINLDGNYNNVRAKLKPSGSTGNYKYVMTADLTVDWDDGLGLRWHNLPIYGGAVIWDLNGHTLTMAGHQWSNDGLESYHARLAVECPTFTLTDSSPIHRGEIDCPNRIADFSASVQTVTLAGGTIVDHCDWRFVGEQTALVITGGSWQNIRRTSDSFPPQTTTVASHVVAQFDGNQQVTSAYDARYYEVINDTVYLVVNLDGNYDNVNTKTRLYSGKGNYKYVMTADLTVAWDDEHRSRNLNIRGNAVIWDLHGHVLTLYGWKGAEDDGTNYWAYLAVWCPIFEITDSSTNHTGKINNWERIADVMDSVEKFTLSGGSVVDNCLINFVSPETQFVITGGVWSNINYYNYPNTTDVAPYLIATYDAGGT